MAVGCSARPDDAYIDVKYRGYWFYIADSDLDSKSAFLLLQILGGSPGGNDTLGSAGVDAPDGQVISDLTGGNRPSRNQHPTTGLPGPANFWRRCRD